MSESESPPAVDEKQYLPTYHGCFVCGQTHPTGLCSRFYTGEGGKVHAEFKPKPTLTGLPNIVHGGIITAFLDELLWWPICLRSGRICYTVELTVKFRSQVFADQTYLGTANPGVQTEGGRFWDGSGNITDANGKVVAEATGKFLLVPEAQTHAFGDMLTYEPGDLPVFKRP